MSGIEVGIVFIVIWWLVLFITLPFGVHQTENPEPGMDPGAPERPLLVTKAMVTTAVATIMTAALYFAIETGWLPIREWLSA